MAIDIEILKSIKYFHGLEPAELETVRKYIIEKNIDKGQNFLTEGEWSEFLYFVISGNVKVYKPFSDGKEQILHISHSGDSLNDVSIFDGQPTVASMVSMTEVKLYAIRKEDLKNILNVNPRISLNIIKSLANRIRHESNLVGDLTSNQVLTRLAKLLIGKYAGEETTIGLSLNQQDMAGMIGTGREVVNRSLKIMEKDGAIKLTPHGVKIINKIRLSAFADANDEDVPKYLLRD
jgi:CRP/FNR family transcriptional regulator, cyclic AMP receptor protein